MKKIRKMLSVTISIVLVLVFTAQPFGIISNASGETDDYIGDYNYTIDNPYATVDWDNWGTYRANTHTHSHLSDGDKDFDEMIEKYYELGYDCLAMTDHGTVNYGWTANKSRHTEFQWSYVLHGDVHALSAQRNLEITTGVGRDGRGMIDVPYGIELNGASAKKVHVNSWFVACGDGDMAVDSTWPESAVQKSQNAGALCHINHVGEWSGGQDSISTYNADFVNRFSQLFINYSACIGMEVVNTSDGRTQNDRYLYDQTLKILAPLGVKCWSFCEDDSHEYGDCGRNASFYKMPSNTAANVRTCMENGAFFASSKNAKGADELGGASASSSVDFPQVNKVSVDEDKDQITFDTTLAKKARIVADGQLVDTVNLASSGDTVTFDLNKYDDYINSYVRIYFTGDGGITYVQPFYLTKTAVERPFVQFVTPSSDTIINVFDSQGNVVEKYNSDNYYLLPAGNYTYSASRQGYESLTDVPFTVTEEDIVNCVQKKINVELQADSGLLTAYFYVPETIYLNTSDLQSFQYYMDRQNSVDGALNSDLKTTGNVFFKCAGASNIDISYEILNGGALNLAQTSASSDSLSTYISSGSLSSALSTAGNTQIKWTATYHVNGTQMQVFAYTFVYAPLVGTSGAAAAGGKAETHKTISWLHDTMDVTGAAFISGVHNVSGGGTAYRFAPYGGESVYACDGPGGAQVGGYGFNTGEDDSDGGSTNANVTGGTATLYIDSSRTNNLNQIPNLAVGLDMLFADRCDESGVTQYLNLGSTNLYTNSSGSATNIADGTRLYYANNNTATKVNYSINSSVSSINLVGQIQGKKSSRTCTSTNTIPLNLIYTNKTDLRNAINNSVKFAVQNEWCLQSTSYDSYIDSIKSASMVLGNPVSTSDDCTAAVQSLTNALKNLELQQSSYTVEKYLDGQLYHTEDIPYSYGRNISVYASNIPGAKYLSMTRYLGETEELTTTDSEDAVFAAGETFTWKIYYSANQYNIHYITSDDNYSPIGGSGPIIQLNGTVTLPTNVPEKTGYSFTGWNLNLDGKTYQAGDTFVWDFDSDAEFTETWHTKSYTLTYDLNGGDPSSFIGEYINTVDYNEEFDLPANPTKAGYNFGGWKIGNDTQLLVGGMRVVWDYDESLTCQAQWIPTDTTAYTVYYYFQNANNNAYTMDVSKLYYGTGTTDSTINASVPEYAGFTHNKNLGKNEGVITADGSLVLTVFYTRNSYDLTIGVDGDDTGNSTCTYNAQNVGTTATYSIKYGAAISEISTVTTNNDLVFCGWWLNRHDGNVSEFVSADVQYTALSTMPNNHCTLTAVYQNTNNYDANSGFAGKSGSIFNKQHNYLITDMQNPQVTNLMYLKNGFDVETTNTNSGFGTRSTIHVFDNNSNSQLLTLIVLGDVTGDGIVDAFDVTQCTSVCNYELDADNIETLALDSDNDGFVDVFDLAMLNAKANYEFL